MRIVEGGPPVNAQSKPACKNRITVGKQSITKLLLILTARCANRFVFRF